MNHPMRRLGLLLSTLMVSVSCLSAKPSYPYPAGTDPLKMIETGNTRLMITANGVLKYAGNELVKVATDPNGINDAILLDHQLFLATRKGLRKLDVDHNFQDGAVAFSNQNISCLAVDTKKRLWVGSLFNGAYMQLSQDSFQLKLEIPSILSMVSSADSNLWIGTNIGLYRINAGDFATTRYAEEGYTGYELPDNVVEHLFADELSNVWVVMPDNLSFKKGNNFQGELPTFDFLGDKDNRVRSILAVNDAWYLFVTDKSISYMPIKMLHEEHQHATEEVHETRDIQARQATNKLLNCPKGWENELVTSAQKQGSEVWFFTAKGCWKVSERRLKSNFQG